MLVLSGRTSSPYQARRNGSQGSGDYGSFNLILKYPSPSSWFLQSSQERMIHSIPFPPPPRRHSLVRVIVILNCMDDCSTFQKCSQLVCVLYIFFTLSCLDPLSLAYRLNLFLKIFRDVSFMNGQLVIRSQLLDVIFFKTNSLVYFSSFRFTDF